MGADPRALGCCERHESPLSGTLHCHQSCTVAFGVQVLKLINTKPLIFFAVFLEKPASPLRVRCVSRCFGRAPDFMTPGYVQLKT